MFDDQETHYPVPGETPWERLRYLATNTETIYPVPPYVCMNCLLYTSPSPRDCS